MENPKCLNVMCPQCRLAWLVPSPAAKLYTCPCCTYVMFDRQVEVYAKAVANDPHDGIYLLKE